MSGIVRGYISGDVKAQTYGFTVATVNNIPFTLPVAVVPLYDATLAAMAEHIARVDFGATGVFDDNFDTAPPDQRAAFLAVALTGLRAALGLDAAGA